MRRSNMDNENIYESLSGYKVWIDQDKKFQWRLNASSPRIGHSFCIVPTGKWNYKGFVDLGILTSTMFADKVALNINSKECKFQGTFILMDKAKFVSMVGFEPRYDIPEELRSSITIKRKGEIRYLGTRHKDAHNYFPGSLRVLTKIGDGNLGAWINIINKDVPKGS